MLISFLVVKIHILFAGMGISFANSSDRGQLCCKVEMFANSSGRRQLCCKIEMFANSSDRRQLCCKIEMFANRRIYMLQLNKPLSTV